MKKELKGESKIASIFYDEDMLNKNIPVIVLNTFDEDGEEIWKLSKELNLKDYILATVSNINWNQDMSPWFMEKLYKNDDDYTGKADEYLKLLENKIIPEIKKEVGSSREFILAGYSLAGLFAVYSIYKTDIFSKIISASGSFWYPNFLEFAHKNQIIHNPEKIYFSLGNKESKTKNELISKVEENTKALAKFYKDKGIETIYEETQGNHFQDVYNRIVKAIKWILE